MPTSFKESFCWAPIENSPPGIQAIPAGALGGAGNLLSMVGWNVGPGIREGGATLDAWEAARGMNFHASSPIARMIARPAHTNPWCRPDGFASTGAPRRLDFEIGGFFTDYPLGGCNARRLARRPPRRAVFFERGTRFSLRPSRRA